MVTDTAVKKGYKQTEMGVIPEDWGVKELKEIVTNVIDNRGKTPPYSNIADIELIETASISFVNQYPDYSKVSKFVSKEVYNYWFRGHPIKNDILISTVGEYSGASAIMKENRGTIAQNLIAIRTKEIDPTYLFYWTRSKNFKKQLNQVMMNQAQPSLRVPWLLNFYITFPKNEPEQSVIVTVLSDTDALIGHLEKLIAKKKAIKQGTMQQLLTGTKRLPGFSGEWKVRELGEIAEIKTGKKNNDDKVEEGLYPFFVRSQQVERIDSYSFEGEAILIPGEGNIGSIYHYINGRFDYHQRVYKISNFAEQYSGKFIYLFMSQHFNVHAMKNSVKATVDSLRLPTFQEFEIFFPPTKSEQTAIASILSDMDAEIERLEQKRDKYKMLKQGMMQQLLMGKIRLL